MVSRMWCKAGMIMSCARRQVRSEVRPVPEWTHICVCAPPCFLVLVSEPKCHLKLCLMCRFGLQVSWNVDRNIMTLLAVKAMKNHDNIERCETQIYDYCIQKIDIHCCVPKIGIFNKHWDRSQMVGGIPKNANQWRAEMQEPWTQRHGDTTTRRWSNRYIPMKHRSGVRFND